MLELVPTKVNGTDNWSFRIVLSPISIRTWGKFLINKIQLDIASSEKQNYTALTNPQSLTMSLMYSSPYDVISSASHSGKKISFSVNCIIFLASLTASRVWNKFCLVSLVHQSISVTINRKVLLCRYGITNSVTICEKFSVKWDFYGRSSSKTYWIMKF